MKTVNLKEHGFKKHHLHNDEYIMPWGGSFTITKDLTLYDMFQKIYDCGKKSGYFDGKLDGAQAIQNKLKILLTDPNEGL